MVLFCDIFLVSIKNVTELFDNARPIDVSYMYQIMKPLKKAKIDPNILLANWLFWHTM